MAKTLTYTGEALLQKQSFQNKKDEEVRLDNYLPSEDLIDAVNLAIQLGRPLLLMGEPGCGKTRLAEAVAYELHTNKMQEHLFRWDIKSTTKAKDGIYQYDALKRLYDVNIQSKKSDVENIKNDTEASEEERNIEKLIHYIEYGSLVNAFSEPQNGDKPNILLIDEIDKADIDFPNDLLLELDTKTFVIPELSNEPRKADSEVLIIITSNQEKELPPAFLRRCIFFFIEFPEEHLAKIVANHIHHVDTETTEKALELFANIRENLSESDKKPSTSELIDWFKMLEYYTEIKKEKRQKSAAEKRLIAQLDLIDKGKIPFRQLLLKTQSANQKIEENALD